MKFTFLIVLILIIQNSILTAQSDVKIKKKEFKTTTKQGFKPAWKHIKAGDSFYSRKGVWYKNAMDEYISAYEYNNGNDGLNYKIGVSALFSDSKDKASDYLIKAYNINNKVSGDILLLTGLSFQYTGKYKEAVEKFQAYLASDANKADKSINKAKKCIDECNSAMMVSKDTVKIEIMNAGSNINSDADDYSEVITPDGMKLYFASRRALDPDAKNYHSDTKLDENILQSELNSGKWGVAIPAGKNLITNMSEAPLFIDKSGKILYVYVGYEGEGDIKYTELKKENWKPVQNERFGINSKAPETSFCISPSGNEIAFVSDRGTRGFGGKDIFIITKKGKKWSNPVNAGESINTRFNEESVRYSKGGDTLWFSSAGHNTMGGFDIFYSVRKGTEGWGPAINAGLPVNSAWNELFYVPSPVDDSLFYFVSDRSGGFGGLDIYLGRIMPIPHVKTVADSVKIMKPDTIVVKDSASFIASDYSMDVQQELQSDNVDYQLYEYIFREGLKGKDYGTNIMIFNKDLLFHFFYF